MADSYVCSGAMMVCSCGTAPAKLTVLPSRTVYLTGQPMANISDFVPNQNIPPFVLCTTCGNPAVSAANGTPQPCMPVTMDPWEKGKDDYLVKNIPALLKSSICRCKWGGVIRIVDDGQTSSGLVDLSRSKLDEITKKEVPYLRKLALSYKPFFAVNQEQIGENAIRAERDFRILMEESSKSYHKVSNWLSSPVPKEESQGEKDKKGNTIDENGLSIENSESELLLKGYVSYNEGISTDNEFSIKESEHSTSFFRERADLSLSLFDCIPLIRNTKATITIILDALIAGFSIGLSFGVDNDLRRYLQLNLNSWIGGDYSDLANFNDIRRKNKKVIECLARKVGRRLCVVRIIPSYQTGVSKPNYDRLDIEGVYIDLDLQLDKLLEICIGTEKVTNISDIVNNGYTKLSGTLNLPNLELRYGWDSKKIDTNAGFYIELTPPMKHTVFEDWGISVDTPLKDDDRPSGLSKIKKKSDSWCKDIYQQDKFDTKAVAKVGSSFTYAWQLENR